MQLHLGRWKQLDDAQFQLSTGTHGCRMPRRDRIYIVGDQGMICRYRVVPVSYAANGILDAPLMPGYGGPILDHVQ
ncbi:MAG TPA: hypothetical protein VEF05_12430 [Terriglobales bacterium]|nr:hypothetical protein [Terriglobales bacterium]